MKISHTVALSNVKLILYKHISLFIVSYTLPGLPSLSFPRLLHKLISEYSPDTTIFNKNSQPEDDKLLKEIYFPIHFL